MTDAPVTFEYSQSAKSTIDLKRSFDVVVASIGIALLWPLMMGIAIAIKLTSPGPVIYRGMRAGLHNQPFFIYKFRTMVVNAERVGGMSTAKNDPRITKIGAFLRRYKLDELPQLFNVLKGDMSFVGPRPEMLAYTNQYTGDEVLILSVRPGITDLASIEFVQLGDILGDQDADRVYEEQVRPVKNALRVKYVQEQSFLGDIWLIFKTLSRIVSK